MVKTNKFIFDVDGTLTPSRKSIDNNFKDFFVKFCIDNKVYIVTGSDYTKTQEQLGEYLLRLPIYVYNCAGNEVRSNELLVREKIWKAPKEIFHTLNYWLAESKFPIRQGHHIEQRTGMINFSIVGRGASISDREIYVKWDTAHEERENIAAAINEKFEFITATVGGDTGIDIHPTGWDKGQIIVDFDMKYDNLYFFGDKMEQGGNDEPLAKIIKNSYQVVDWRDTWKQLIHLQKENLAK
jgi:phosphomannomutase